MSATDNDEPAFPFPMPPEPEHWDGHYQEGMSLRDYFAAKAMCGELAAMCPTDSNEIAALALDVSDDQLTRLSRHWYRIADAMLKARQR